MTQRNRKVIEKEFLDEGLIQDIAQRKHLFLLLEVLLDIRDSLNRFIGVDSVEKSNQGEHP